MKVVVLAFCILETLAGTDNREAFKELPIQEYIIFSFVCIFLVLLGGLMSGLTVGLLGIDEIALELKITSGTEEEKRDALKVLHVVENHHLLLVTLLLANAIAMEALPLFLDTMFNTEISVIISVTFILAFGEVIPQSVCTGPNQLKIACKCIPIVRVFIIILYPLSYPIAKLLDRLLGEKETKKKLDDQQLRTFIGIQKLDENDSSGLDVFQIKMMNGLMDLSQWPVNDLKVPLAQVPMIEKNDIISQELIKNVMASDFLFVVVFALKKANVCGSFSVKKIFAALKEKTFLASQFQLEDFLVINQYKNCLDALKMMTSAVVEMLFVANDNGEVIGVIRKSDVMDKVLLSHNLGEKNGINEISNALISVLEHREKHHQSSSKTEVVKRTKRIVSH
jgi:metal transporter CNNM